jgi:hypothetical protein
MLLEFSDPEGFIMGECTDKRMKRKDVAKTYALLMRHEGAGSFDWAKINAAIIERWMDQTRDKARGILPESFEVTK